MPASSGGTPRKVDLHTHILPPDWPDLGARFGCSGFPRLKRDAGGGARIEVEGRLFRKIDRRCWNVETRLQDCNRDGVDLQVLSTVPVMFCYWAEPRHARELARLLNDHIAEVVSGEPGRFAGLGTLPMQDPDLAIAELRRCREDLGLDGVQIGTHVNGWNLDRPEVVRVLEAAQDLGAAVFVHPWDMLGKERMQRFMLRWLVGMPAETSLAICSLLLGGVLEKLPRLRIAFAHGGGAFPASLGRVEKGYRSRPDLCATDARTPPQGQLDRIYLDTLVHDERALRFLMEIMGAHRLAVGSDYPFPLGEDRPGSLVEAATWMDEGDRRRLLAGTALEFLGRSGAGTAG